MKQEQSRKPMSGYPMLLVSLILLAIYYALDLYLYNREEIATVPSSADGTVERLGLEGNVNLLLLLGVIGSVLLSGFWRPATPATRPKSGRPGACS